MLDLRDSYSLLSLFSIIFLINLAFIVLISSFNGLLLLLIIPWTLLIYIVLCFKGYRYSSDNPIHKMAGRLYWISKGSFNASIIAIFNVILGALIVPDASLIQFDAQFGPFTSLIVFVFLPLPGFLIISLQGEEQEKFYRFFLQEVTNKNEVPDFIILTNDLITNQERYSEDYRLQLEKVKESVYQYIETDFPGLIPFFEPKQSFKLNSVNLAVFLTKKLMTTEV